MFRCNRDFYSDDNSFMKIRLEFKPQDLWVGVFWKRGDEAAGSRKSMDIWICLVPMLPIHLIYEWDVDAN